MTLVAAHPIRKLRNLMGRLERKRAGKDGKVKKVMKATAVLVFCGLAAALVWSLTHEGRKEQPLLWCRIISVMTLAFGFSAVQLLTFAISWPLKQAVCRYGVYLINGLKSSVDVTQYFCLLLAEIHVLILPRMKIWTIPAPQVFRFLVALCVGAFLWLLKNFLYLMLEAEVRYL